jgi:hypothetical protein
MRFIWQIPQKIFDITLQRAKMEPYYIEDIFLYARVADKVAREAGSTNILTDNCEGEGPVTELIKAIL